MKTFKQFINEAIKIKLGSGRPANVTNFLDEYENTTDEHPFDGRSRIHGDNATSEVYHHNGKIHLSDIRALKPGGGSAALEHIKSLADKHGVEITGHAKAYSQSKKYPMNTKQLGKYYKKRGFDIEGSEDDGYKISYKPKKKDQ